MEFIPYGRQAIRQKDVDSVVEVLTSDFLTQGPMVPRFEQALAAKCGVKEVCALNSATSALHVACLALGIGSGDTVWTSPISFVASANCALYCGAKVDFVDVDQNTTNICPASLEEKLLLASRKNNLPKALIVVHMGGRSAEMSSIAALCKPYGIRIIEDASHAIGGFAWGAPIGQCEYSDLCVFSFHPVKIITTGEGGAITSKDAGLVNRCKLLRSHGITRDPASMENDPEGAWVYEQIALGLNYRMTDIQAALGYSQLDILEESIGCRQRIARTYHKELESLPLERPAGDDHIRSAWHLYVVRTLDDSGLERKELFDFLRERNIGVNVHYKPIHTQPYYQRLGFCHGQFPVAENYYARAITLPIHPSLSEAQHKYVLEHLRDFYR